MLVSASRHTTAPPWCHHREHTGATGQSLGVMLAATLTDRMGSGWVISLSGASLVVVGAVFAQALKRRDAFMHLE